MPKGKKFTQLQEGERNQIEALLSEGFSFSHIARKLGRSVSTISREFSRNQLVSTRKGRFYEGSKAQDLARRRHRLKR